MKKSKWWKKSPYFCHPFSKAFSVSFFKNSMYTRKSTVTLGFLRYKLKMMLWPCHYPVRWRKINIKIEYLISDQSSGRGIYPDNRSCGNTRFKGALLWPGSSVQVGFACVTAKIHVLEAGCPLWQFWDYRTFKSSGRKKMMSLGTSPLEKMNTDLPGPFTTGNWYKPGLERIPSHFLRLYLLLSFSPFLFFSTLLRTWPPPCCHLPCFHGNRRRSVQTELMSPTFLGLWASEPVTKAIFFFMYPSSLSYFITVINNKETLVGNKIVFDVYGYPWKNTLAAEKHKSLETTLLFQPICYWSATSVSQKRLVTGAVSSEDKLLCLSKQP